MIQALLFLHLLGVAMLFIGMGIEVAAFANLHRAKSVQDVRAAMLAVPTVGTIMGPAAMLLVAMGVAMVYLTGFGWQPWTVVGLAVAIALSINGPLTNGRRSERIHALALHAPDGPIPAELEAARRDRFLNYSVGSMLTFLIAMLYVMSAKPALPGCLIALAIAAAVPLVPMLRVQPAPEARPATAET